MLEVDIFIDNSDFVIMSFYVVGPEGTTFVQLLNFALIMAACAQIPLIKAVSLI